MGKVGGDSGLGVTLVGLLVILWFGLDVTTGEFSDFPLGLTLAHIG